MESNPKDVLSELLKIRASLGGKELDQEGEVLEDKTYGEEYLSKLKAACESFLEKESFKVGQIVRWKENLKNRRFPRQNQPAIVIAVLEEPIISPNNEAGSPYFLEPLDIILGILVDKENESNFLTIYCDSRRFEAYDESSPL